MADIPQSLRSWSATASANQPTDSTTIGSGLDDNLRVQQATVRQFLASYGSNIASAATMDLSTMDGYAASVSGNTTVTGLGTESAGISYVLTFASTPMFKNSASLITGSDITFAAGDIASFISEGAGTWRMTGLKPSAGYSGSGAIARATSASLTTPTVTNGSLVSTTATTAAADDNSSFVANTAWVLGQAATQAEQETASSTTKFVTSGRAHFHPGVPKAWGSVSTPTTVQQSYPSAGVSVVKNSTGSYTVTHGRTFSTSTYAVSIAPLEASTVVTPQISARTTTTFTVLFNTHTGADTSGVTLGAAIATDPAGFSYALLGDL